MVHFEHNGAKQKRNVHDKKIELLFLSLEPHGLKGLFVFGAFSLENTLFQDATSLYFLQQTETSRLEEGELCQKQGSLYRRNKKFGVKEGVSGAKRE